MYSNGFSLQTLQQISIMANTAMSDGFTFLYSLGSCTRMIRRGWLVGDYNGIMIYIYKSYHGIIMIYMIIQFLKQHKKSWTVINSWSYDSENGVGLVYCFYSCFIDVCTWLTWPSTYTDCSTDNVARHCTSLLVIHETKGIQGCHRNFIAVILLAGLARWSMKLLKHSKALDPPMFIMFIVQKKHLGLHGLSRV